MTTIERTINPDVIALTDRRDCACCGEEGEFGMLLAFGGVQIAWCRDCLKAIAIQIHTALAAR